MLCLTSDQRFHSLLLLLGVAVVLNPLIRAQTKIEESQKFTLKGARVESRLVVTVELSNGSDQRILVPYCGEMAGELYLCNPATRVEARRGAKWVSPLTDCCAVLGGAFNGRTIVIEPRSARTFVYQIRRDSVKIRRGDRLRVIADAWPEGAKVGDDATVLRLRTEPFDAPLSAAGQ
jgi:hypothetical protein